MTVQSPGTIANSLKKSKKTYQTKSFNPKGPDEQVHYQITQGLTRLKALAKKEAPGPTAEKNFLESKKGTVRQMQKYRKLLTANRQQDPNKDRLPAFLRTFGWLTLAVSLLEYQKVEFAEVEDFDPETLPELTAEQQALLDSPNPDALLPEAPKAAAAAPAPAGAGALARKIATIEAHSQKILRTLKPDEQARVTALLQEAKQLAAGQPEAADDRLNQLIALAKQAQQDVGARCQRAYEKLLPDVQARLAQFPAPYSEQVVKWRAALEDAEGLAEQNNWDQAALALNRLLGSINAQLATEKGNRHVEGGNRQMTRKAKQARQQLHKLDGLDASIARNARKNYQEEVDLDQGLLVNTHDEPRPVPAPKPGLGPNELKELATQVIQGAIPAPKTSCWPTASKGPADDVPKGAKGDQILARAEAVAKDFVEKRLDDLPPQSDEVFDLSLKSEADLRADAAVALGLVKPEQVQECRIDARKTSAKSYAQVVSVQQKWFAALKPKEQALVNAMAQGMLQAINVNTPNKLDPATKAIELNGQEYEFVKVLGAGAQGTVSQYRKKGTNEVVVIKSLNNQANRLAMEQELRIHRQAMGGEGGEGHPNIVPMRGVVRGSDGSLHMVMDHAKGGDLADMSDCLSYAVADGALPPAAAQVLAQQFVSDAVAGLKFLQEQNVTHHDIKALNFLLDEDGTVMLADFGSGQLGRDEKGTVPGIKDPSVQIDVTPNLEAPELYSMTATGKADTFTLGIVVDRLMNGHRNRFTAAGVWSKYNGPPVPDAVDRLTRAMLDPDPEKRPTLEAVEHSSLLSEAGSHDPDLVARLKAASMEYARVANKCLRAKITAEWAKAHNGVAASYVSEANPQPFGAVLNGLQAKLPKMEKDLAAKEDTLAQLTGRQQRRLDQLRQQIASGMAAEKEVAEKEREAMLYEVSKLQKAIKWAKDELAQAYKDQETIQVAVFAELRMDPDFERAEAGLKAAAAPFSSVTEDSVEALSDLRRRGQAVAEKLAPIRQRVAGAPVNQWIAARFTALEVAGQNGDVHECRRMVQELEDYCARVVGTPERRGKLLAHEDVLARRQAARNQLEAQKQQEREQLWGKMVRLDDPRAAGEKAKLDQQARQLEQKYAELLKALDKKFQPEIDQSLLDLDRAMESLE
jgi:hypothetical protein